MEKRNLDIGYSIFGEESYGQRGTTIGLDVEPINTEWQEMTGAEVRKPSFPEIQGEAQNLPFASNSLDRVTSSNTIGFYVPYDEGIPEAVRVLKPGGTGMIIIDPDDVEGGSKSIRDLLTALPVTNVRIRRVEEGEPNVRVSFRKVDNA